MDAINPEILNRFSKSWAETQKSYEHLINQPEFNLLIPLYLFIQKSKRAGGDKFFRLGIAMQDLIFSRSAEIELGPNQKYVKVKALAASFEVTLRDGAKMYRQYLIKDLEDERLTGLLQTLKDTQID